MSIHLNATKVRWRCRRGMLELDVILERFFDQHYAHLSPEEQLDFQDLLNCTDQDLLNWLVNGVAQSDPHLKSIIHKISVSSLD